MWGTRCRRRAAQHPELESRGHASRAGNTIDGWRQDVLLSQCGGAKCQVFLKVAQPGICNRAEISSPFNPQSSAQLNTVAGQCLGLDIVLVLSNYARSYPFAMAMCPLAPATAVARMGAPVSTVVPDALCS
jgi:hypothetical protein